MLTPLGASGPAETRLSGGTLSSVAAASTVGPSAASGWGPPTPASGSPSAPSSADGRATSQATSATATRTPRMITQRLQGEGGGAAGRFPRAIGSRSFRGWSAGRGQDADLRREGVQSIVHLRGLGHLHQIRPHGASERQLPQVALVVLAELDHPSRHTLEL